MNGGRKSTLFYIYCKDKSMKFLDYFHYSAIDSEWDADMKRMQFRFILNGTDDTFESNVDFMAEDSNIWINFMVRYKPAKFFREKEYKKQFYTNLSSPSFNQNDIAKYSQEKYTKEIFSVITDDPEYAYINLDDDFFNDTIDDLGGIKSIFYDLTKKIFETRSM
mgnify:CR=1 FL=1